MRDSVYHADQIFIERDIENSLSIYLESIGNYDVLTAEEEHELGKKISEGKEAKLLLDQFPSNMSATVEDISSESISSLRKKIFDGEAAKNKMIKHNLKLVVSYTKKYWKADELSRLDLIQEGNIGLIKAVDHFDYKAGYKFSTYATWWIRQSVNRAIHSTGKPIRIPEYMSQKVNQCRKFRQSFFAEYNRWPSDKEVAKGMKVSESAAHKFVKYDVQMISLDEKVSSSKGDYGQKDTTWMDVLVDDDPKHDPYRAAQIKDAENAADKYLSILSERERYIIEHRFGIGENPEESLKDIGKDLSLSSERVRQLQIKAMKKMQEYAALEVAGDRRAEEDVKEIEKDIPEYT